MINPQTGLAYNQAAVQISEEMIPSEGSSIHRDGRLYDLGEVSPGGRISLNSQTFGSRVNRTGLDRPLGAPMQGSEVVSAGYQVDPTEGLSSRDAKLVEKHLPGEAYETTTYTTEQAVLSQPYTVEQAVYTQQPASYTIEQAGLTVPENVTYSSQVVGNPQVFVNSPGMESIERRLGETTISGTPIIQNNSYLVANNAANVSTLTASPLQASMGFAAQSNIRYQNHQAFENWEVNRNVFMTDRLNIIDDLIAGMEAKIQWLDAGSLKTIAFFKDREAQEHEFFKKARNNLPQLGQHFEAVNQPMFDFSRGMKESDAFHAMQTRNSEIMANYIKKDILDWILIPGEKTFKANAQALRGPLQMHRKKLESHSSRRNRAYNKYFKAYDKAQRNPQRSAKYEDKMFRRQMKYSQSANEELAYLKVYSEQGLMVIREFTTLSANKIIELQRVFTLYLQKYTELHQNTVTPPEPIMELIDKSDGVDGARQLFAPNAIMSPANYAFMQTKAGKPEISYADLEMFLVYFPESIDPARSSFVLQEWPAIREGNSFRKAAPCTVVATNANNLLIIEKRPAYYNNTIEQTKIRDPLQLRNLRCEGIEGATDEQAAIISLVETTPGKYYKRTHKDKLRFETPQMATSFLSYVNNQYAMLNGEIASLEGQPGLISGDVLPAGTTYAGGAPITNLGGIQGSPIAYQTGLGASQVVPINTESVITRQYIPATQSGLTTSPLATPIRGQVTQLNEPFTPITQNNSFVTPVRGQTIYQGEQLAASQPGQVIYQPVNQVGQMTGEL